MVPPVEERRGYIKNGGAHHSTVSSRICMLRSRTAFASILLVADRASLLSASLVRLRANASGQRTGGSSVGMTKFMATPKRTRSEATIPYHHITRGLWGWQGPITHPKVPYSKTDRCEEPPPSAVHRYHTIPSPPYL